MAQVIKQGKKSYLIRVSCGYDSRGKQKTTSKTWRVPSGISKREEERLLNEFVAEFENRVLGGDYVKAVTFKELAEQWFPIAEQKLKPATIATQKLHCKRVYEHFGNMKVDKITTLCLQKYVNQLAKSLAPGTIKTSFAVISNVLTYAYQIGMIKENPCKRVVMPKKQTKEKEILTIEEMRVFCLW